MTTQIGRLEVLPTNPSNLRVISRADSADAPYEQQCHVVDQRLVGIIGELAGRDAYGDVDVRIYNIDDSEERKSFAVISTGREREAGNPITLNDTEAKLVKIIGSGSVGVVLGGENSDGLARVMVDATRRFQAQYCLQSDL